MIHLFFHSYLLYITYLFSNIRLILGHNSMDNSSIILQWENMMFLAFISMAFGIFVSRLIDSYQLLSFIPIAESSKQYPLLNNGTTKNRVERDKVSLVLSRFEPLQSYRSFHIDQTTSYITVDELIAEAKETNRFTFFPYDDKLSNQIFIQIEFIQESQSIIIIFEVFQRQSYLFHSIEHLFSIIFDSSNTIHTWGNISHLCLYYQDYSFFFHKYIDKVRLSNTQQHFKLWYNQTFPHHENCGQIVDFYDIDGPLCSCSYRPYKCLKDNWSLHMAIAYTFHERLSNENEHTHECLAITQLATVIQEKWTRQQIKDYIKEHHADHQRKMTLQ